MLSPKQFGSKVFYHGTTPEAAEAISREGFSLKNEANGRSGGQGVYLTSKPEIAREFGESLVEVNLRKGTKINREDSISALLPSMRSHYRATMAQNPDMSHEDYWVQHSQSEGFGGHRDDDGSIIVYDPKNVGYRGHSTVGMVDNRTASEQFSKRSGL